MSDNPSMDITPIPSAVHPPRDEAAPPAPIPVSIVPGEAEQNLADLLTRLTLEVWALRKATCEQNGWPFIDYNGIGNP